MKNDVPQTYNTFFDNSNLGKKWYFTAMNANTDCFSY